MENRCPHVLDLEGRDIHAEVAVLRAQGPAAQIELPGGVLAWTVTSYEAAKLVLSDPRVAKNPRTSWPAHIQGEIPEDWPLNSWVAMDNMTTRDGTEHSRLRKLVAPAFTLRRTEAMRPNVEKTVNDLLNELAATPQGQPVDLKRNFAYQLPARIICDLFGVPQENRAAVLRGGEVATDSSVTPEEAQANVEHWTNALAQLLESKRLDPADDLTTMLVQTVGEDGSPLSMSEMIGTLFLVLGAGSETVMNLVTSAVRELLLHPRQRALLEAGEVTWSDVIEETLRREAPIAQLPLRFALEDIDLGEGVVIPKGAPILMGFAAVGRDPALHGDTAGEFDLTRANKEHLSFGFGAHFCLGAPLARLEAGIALPALFDRFPGITLAVAPEELQPQGTFIMNGSLTLPLYLEPRT